MKRPLKILVPVDFSRYSLETLRFALSLGDLFQPNYLVLHVVASGEVETFASLGGESENLSLHREEARVGLEAITRQEEELHPGLVLETRIATGVPFKEICRVADEECCELIVIGTHGRTGLSHLLIGSTAERVVQLASCPVLSIKPKVL
jgi:nucleotide-binding universal stress UspA family protein